MSRRIAQVVVRGLALRVVVRVQGQVEHRPRAEALVRVPRVTRLDRRFGVANEALVPHVIEDRRASRRFSIVQALTFPRSVETRIMRVDVASPGGRRRVRGRRDIAVAAIDVLDREGRVEAESKQPAPDEKRDRIPRVMRQLVSQDRPDESRGPFGSGQRLTARGHFQTN